MAKNGDMMKNHISIYIYIYIHIIIYIYISLDIPLDVFPVPAKINWTAKGGWNFMELDGT